MRLTCRWTNTHGSAGEARRARHELICNTGSESTMRAGGRGTQADATKLDQINWPHRIVTSTSLPSECSTNLSDGGASVVAQRGLQTQARA